MFRHKQVREQEREREPFTYDPLDLKADSIRLLHIEGFDEHGQVKCSLKHANVSTARYYAVSYEWGISDNKQCISVNGRALEVQCNIHNFLIQVAVFLAYPCSQRLAWMESPTPTQQLKSTAPSEVFTYNAKPSSDFCWWCACIRCQCAVDTHLLEIDALYPHDRQEPARNTQQKDSMRCLDGFWIDAICLDQSNIEERNHQVQQMHAIYSSASLVLSWLGRNSAKMSRWLCEAKVTNQYIAKTNKRSSRVCINYGVLRHVWALTHWSRAWVVQETVAAKSIMLMCGSFVIPWDLFIVVGPQSNGSDTAFQASRMFAYERLRCRGQNLELEDFATRFRSLGCTDVRDRIYSLKALVKGGPGFPVRYGENLLQLAVRTAMHFGGNVTLFDRLASMLNIKDALFGKGETIVDSDPANPIVSRVKVIAEHQRLDSKDTSSQAYLRGRFASTMYRGSSAGTRGHQHSQAETMTLNVDSGLEECPLCGTRFGLHVKDLSFSSLEEDSDVCPTDVCPIICAKGSGEPFHFIYFAECGAWIGPYSTDPNTDKGIRTTINQYIERIQCDDCYLVRTEDELPEMFYKTEPVIALQVATMEAAEKSLRAKEKVETGNSGTKRGIGRLHCGDCSWMSSDDNLPEESLPAIRCVPLSRGTAEAGEKPLEEDGETKTRTPTRKRGRGWKKKFLSLFCKRI